MRGTPTSTNTSTKITPEQVNNWQTASRQSDKNGFDKTPAGDGKRLAEVLVESCIADNGPEYTNEDVEVLIAAAINKTGSTLRIGGASDDLRTAFFDRLVELAITKAAEVAESDDSTQEVNGDKLNRLFMMLVLPMADQEKFYTKYWENVSNRWLTESYLYKAIKKSALQANKKDIEGIKAFLFALMKFYSKEINYNKEISSKEKKRCMDGESEDYGYTVCSSERGIIKIDVPNSKAGPKCYEITKYFSTVLTFLHSSCDESNEGKRNEIIKVIEDTVKYILIRRIHWRKGYKKNYIPYYSAYNGGGATYALIGKMEERNNHISTLFSRSFSLVALDNTIADSFLTAVGPALPTSFTNQDFKRRASFYQNLHLAYEIIRHYLIMANLKEKELNYQESKIPLAAHVQGIDPSSASTGDSETLLGRLKKLADLAIHIKSNVDANVAKLFLEFEAGNAIKFTENLENRTQGLEAPQRTKLVNQATRLCEKLASLEKYAGLSGQEGPYTKHLAAKNNPTALRITAGQATQNADKIHLLLESIKNATTTEELTEAYNEAQPLVSSQVDNRYKHDLAIALLEAEAANSVLTKLMKAHMKNREISTSKDTEKVLIDDIANFLNTNLDNTDKKTQCFLLICKIHVSIARPQNHVMGGYIKNILNPQIPSNAESENPQNNSKSLGTILLGKINEPINQPFPMPAQPSAPPADDSHSSVIQADNTGKQQAHSYIEHMSYYPQENSAQSFTADDFVIAYIVAKEIFDNKLLTLEDETQLIQSLAQKQYDPNFGNINFAEAVALLYFFHQFSSANKNNQDELFQKWPTILQNRDLADSLWMEMTKFAHTFKDHFDENQLAKKLEKECRKIYRLPDPDDRLGNLELARNSAEIENKRLRSEVNRLTSDLSLQVQENQRLGNDLQNKNTKIATLSETTEKLVQENCSLKKQLQSDSEKHSTEITEQHEKIEELEKQNKESTGTIETQSTELEEKNKEVERLQADLQQAQEEIQTLKKQAQQQTTATPATSGSQSRTTKNLVGEINKNRRKIIKKHKEDAEDSENPKVKMDKHVKQYPPKPALTSEAKKFYDCLFLFAMQEYQNIESDTDNSEDHADNCWVLLCLAELITQCETANIGYATDEQANSLIKTLETIQEHIVDPDRLRSDNQHTTAIESSLNRVGSLLGDPSSGFFGTPDRKLSNELTNTKDALGFDCNN